MNTTENIEKPGRPRKPGELTFTLLLFLVSLTISYFAFNISDLSSMSSTGSIPMLAALFLLFSSLTTLIKTSQMSTNSAAFSDLITPRILIFFASITLGYILIINQLGFLASSILFLFFSILVLHRQGPLLAILISVNALAVIYVVFRVVFKVILPEASLWE
ncbi:MAG: putative tricarboxylic transport membrane protein [Flavobacterium sp.]|jgi:putative tricarboxylic transport membrane protein